MRGCLHETGERWPSRNGNGLPDPAAEQVEIDIAAAQDQADLAAPVLVPLLQRRGERRRAGALGKIMGVGPVGLDRRSDLVVGDLHDLDWHPCG